MTMRNAEFYLKEATVIYAFHLLVARLFNFKHRSKFLTDHSSGERWYKIVQGQFAEMTVAIATKQASVTTLHVSVVWAFLQK